MKNMKSYGDDTALVAGITEMAFCADIPEIVGDPGTGITDGTPPATRSRMVNGHRIESYVENDVATVANRDQ